MKKALLGVSGAVVFALCSGCGSSEGTFTEEDIATNAAAIGEAGCSTAPNDATASTRPPPFESPLTYSNSSCFKAWVVRLNNYVPESNRFFEVAYISALPTTKATCEAAWVRGDMYKLINSSFQFVESASETGVWNGSSCSIKGRFVTNSSGTYKFALTARPSTASSAATRAVRLGTIFIPG